MNKVDQEKREPHLSKKAKYILYSSIALVLLIFFSWILWETYQANKFGFDKTLWQWMELLLVPILLAIAGYWFTSSQKQTELKIAGDAREEDRKTAAKNRETDIEIALERQRQQTLEKYLDRMKELLLDRELGPEAKPIVKKLARTLTLNVLRELNAKRNIQVVQFLQESDLLMEQEIVHLREANLRAADLSGANLYRVNLYGADLRGAKLSEANLRGAVLGHADLRGADLRGADLSDAKLRNANLRGADLSEANLYGADLSGANLSKANLSEADLRGANLSKADLYGADMYGANLYVADLSEADLRGANLSGARNWTAERLLQAKTLDDATMPDGQKYEEWIKPIEGQTDNEAASNDK